MRVAAVLAVLAAVVASAVLLTGCASVSAPKPAKATTYQTLSQLRTAYQAAGGTCPVWIEDDDISAAAQSGGCNNGIILSTYLTAADVLKETDTLRDPDDNGGSSTQSRSELLIGPNWIVTGPSVRKLQPKLGGQLVVVNPNATN
jgi:hypothetical protein